jgi:hypothetical protein
MRRCLCRTASAKVCPAYRRVKDSWIISTYNDGVLLRDMIVIHGYETRWVLLYNLRRLGLPKRRKPNGSHSFCAAE